ncbi:P-loop containing nucleoside triphosphate hydrolase protein [Phakopsora pachyrhizi]|nr:P-loop containing nucleoside triphosphate hydrolase protein [Phakopsora pachyrhizi]
MTTQLTSTDQSVPVTNSRPSALLSSRSFQSTNDPNLVLSKPFTPLRPISHSSDKSSATGRKRKAVNYSGADIEENEEEGKKAGKKGKDRKSNEDELEEDEDGNMVKRVKRDRFGRPIKELVFTAVRKFGKVSVKPLDSQPKAFCLPKMIDPKTGALMEVRLTGMTLGARPQPVYAPRPLHDPLSDTAIVLWDPTVDDRPAPKSVPEGEPERTPQEIEEERTRLKLEEERMRGPHKSLPELLGIKKGGAQKEVQKVAVVLDPKLSKTLRPHQVEGVKFLYKCATGMVEQGALGCIMADEMGLGKTLQCITLLWTLLKQSPVAGKSTIEKAIVACPSSLVKNWANEFDKWLGPGAVNCLAVDGKQSKADLLTSVRQWVMATGRRVPQPVMIVSYETLRGTLVEELGNAPVGLLLCDEGHRLKNAENQTYAALNSIKCERRVILTGTPIQNDLSEYFALLNFANPNYLGDRAQFRKNYELPILRGRDSDSSEAEVALAETKLKDLTARVQKFIIRRTNDLLSKYLPVKYEHVVFCAPSSFQLDLYRHFISSPELQKLLKGVGCQPLKMLGILRKLCNHPDLLDLHQDIPGSESCFPEGYRTKDYRAPSRPELSGKMLVLERFLHKIKTETTDKIVLISNFTQTLDVMEKMCRERRWGTLRLDGTMQITKRQKLVDKFNNPEGKEFIFLLSSKAGGCGINLIGANRLVLFDPDWNPASDQQALARVWRDGQKKECFVYRFILTGSVEEKVFQRQSQKMKLSASVVDEQEDEERMFSRDALRELFKLNENTNSDTHDVYKCKRCENGIQIAKAPAMLYGDQSTWNHYTNSTLVGLHDDLLRSEVGLNEVTACFQYVST